jgi:hypothetical protein
MKDNIGIAVIKISSLYKDNSLSKKELRRRTKYILNEFRNNELVSNQEYIKKLQVSAEELKTLKRILK